MDVDTIFRWLDQDTHPARCRKILTKYLKHQLAVQRRQPDDSRRIAYEIAGLLATRFADRLPDDDRHIRILLLAGEIELSPAGRAPDAWHALAPLIEALETPAT